jgi:DNA invertase Pin-like site-specific DNA recombinase
MGLEVSRLARNCADWHRLIEICALAGTLYRFSLELITKSGILSIEVILLYRFNN